MNDVLQRFPFMRTNLKSVLLVCSFFFGLGITAKAQVPVNNDTTGAITMTVNSDTSFLNAVSTNMTLATPSAPAAMACIGVKNHDVWYKFTATASTMVLTFQGATVTIYVGIYHMVGSALTYDNCFYPPSSTTSSGYYRNYVSGLTVGTSYYIRADVASSSQTPTYSMCVGNLPAPPVNDNVAGAIMLPTATATCSGMINGTTWGATQSPQAAPSCGPTSTDDDVWYQFTTGATPNYILNFGLPTATTWYVTLYTGTPGSLLSLTCGSVNTQTGAYIFNGLSPNTTYYLRLYSSGTATSPFYGNYSFCLKTGDPAPVNDEIAGAITVPVNPGMACLSTTTGTTFGATQSLIPVQNFGPEACNGNSYAGPGADNDDIFYKFNAGMATGVQLTFSNTTNSATMNAVLYYDTIINAVPSYAFFACNAGSNIHNFTGLVPNRNYYLRTYVSDNNTQSFSTFTLCIASLPLHPSNDEPSGAVLIVPTNDLSCTGLVQGTTYGATATTGMPAPLTNPSSADNDVWYKFTPANSSILLKVVPATGNSSLVYQVYKASDSSIVTTATGNASSPNIVLQNLTPGVAYLLSIYNSTGNPSATGAYVYSNFTLCIANYPTPPVNDTINGSITLIPNNNYNPANIVAGSTAGATYSFSPPSTGLSSSTGIDDDIFYKFTANATTQRVFLTNMYGSSTSLAYGVYSGSSASPTLIGTGTPSSSANTAFDVTGLTIGQTYYLRLYTTGANFLSNTGTVFCGFNIYIGKNPTAPANDSVVHAIYLPVSQGFGGNTVVGTLAGATPESNLPAATCGTTGYANFDVWYKTTIPASGNLIVQTAGVNLANINNDMAIYSGTPNNLTQIACDQDGNLAPAAPSAAMSRIALVNRNPGDTVYIRVFPNTPNTNPIYVGSFAIEVWDTTNHLAISPGGACIDAAPTVINATTGNSYTWVPVKDANNEIIAEIFANGNNLDTVRAHVYENTGTIRLSNGVSLLDRNLTMSSTLTPITPITVRLYLTNAEFMALQTADPSLIAPANLNVSFNNQPCSGSIDGIDQLVPQSANGTYYGDKYIEVPSNNLNTIFMRASGFTPDYKLNIGNDTVICQGTMLSLNANNAGASYVWSTGDTTQSINVSTTGIYKVTVSSGSITATDSVNIAVSPLPVVNLGNDTTLTAGQSLTLDAANTGATFLWNTGATTQTLNVTTEGTYSVVVTNTALCKGSDSIHVGFTVGINSVDKNNSINIFPNPSTNQITVRVNNTAYLNSVLVISDVSGHIVKTTKIDSKEQNISLADIIPGIYFIKIGDSNVLKLVKE